MPSKKVKKFASEPAGNKHVSEIGGIGEKFGKQLEEEDYEYAKDLLIEFMRLGETEHRFKRFLGKLLPRANTKHIQDCYESVAGWCDNYPKEKYLLLYPKHESEE
ncbi:barrier-to-autointegration factor-like [Mercenaria mercenaria]|uniref:barrier-to-autointegration factor-like n=1 Tax=Mercenaria mercenaria TaxID=6596 RepID=UPI00234F801C|nr:barrier-to-autointegration factor-like [Mercenaria mercenaria]XP_053396802.1 barrier-to-autointegration factor-like [Mercenaria mercenaria]